MTPSRSGILIAILAGSLLAAIAVIVLMATSGDGNGGGDSVFGPRPSPSPPSSPTLAASATTAPSATSVPSPSPQPTQPPLAPTEPPPPPQIRSCAEIRADPVYRSEAERQFFLQNCQPAAAPTPQPGQQPPAQPPPPPAPAGLTAEEESYVRRASQVNLEYTARLTQYWSQPSFGALADLYELGSVALNHANALNSLEPVPARYRTPHNSLVGTLLAFRDHIFAVGNVNSQQAFVAWLATFERRSDDLDTTLVAYQTAVGITVVDLGGLR